MSEDFIGPDLESQETDLKIKKGREDSRVPDPLLQ